MVCMRSWKTLSDPTPTYRFWHINIRWWSILQIPWKKIEKEIYVGCLFVFGKPTKQRSSTVLFPYHTPSNCWAFAASVNRASGVGASVSSDRTRLRTDLCFSMDASLPLLVNETASKSWLLEAWISKEEGRLTYGISLIKGDMRLFHAEWKAK